MMAKRMIRDLVLGIRPVSLFGGQYRSDSSTSDDQSSDESEDNSNIQGMSSRLSLSEGVDADSPTGVIGSPATPQTEETESETAEDKIRRLERENMKLKQTIIEAKDRSISMIANKKGTMKLGGKRPDYGGKDALNCTHAYSWAVDYFRRVKFIGDGLGQYSEDEGSMCQRILRCGIQIPDDCNPEQYYYSCVAKMVLFKIRILKTNFMTVGREAFMSAYYLMC